MVENTQHEVEKVMKNHSLLLFSQITYHFSLKSASKADLKVVGFCMIHQKSTLVLTNNFTVKSSFFEILF
ncbi:Hypothetical Protein CTN_0536 [Thermotoga neapolitana DSM 4359]|uniref:Uncharacterized protein n=1 Tax=Thermotoga neapolitana (strain ATCC 49049 / DSM 4359 / NBRC 107923 / NS-E) TaxID=309803 RepID=B9K6X9_THENN|nr:Hypothetical Protein CTN_0536 [Thermotoga neapolitana DSM 4359]